MKHVVASCFAVASMLAVTGCQMCTAPIVGDPSCIEESHVRGAVIMPEVANYSKPVILPTVDAFRPSFRAGDRRVSAIGAGNSLEDASADAISKLLNENKCDYIVAVKRIVTKKTHPVGFLRFFPTTNYSVSISGLPIYLEKLEKVKVEEKLTSAQEKQITVIVNNILQKIKLEFKNSKVPLTPPIPSAPMALLNLTDINLSMTAKGATKDPVAVAVPAPRCPQGKK